MLDSLGPFENVNYYIVETFDGIETISVENALGIYASQSFNDMLEDFDSIDEQSLIESLAGYYYSYPESFDGLSVEPENMERFYSVKNWVIEYYDEV